MGRFGKADVTRAHGVNLLGTLQAASGKKKESRGFLNTRSKRRVAKQPTKKKKKHPTQKNPKTQKKKTKNKKTKPPKTHAKKKNTLGRANC